MMCEHCGRYRVAYVWRRIKVMRLCAPCFQFVLHGWLKHGEMLLPVIKKQKSEKRPLSMFRLTAPLPQDARPAYIDQSTVQTR